MFYKYYYYQENFFKLYLAIFGKNTRNSIKKKKNTPSIRKIKDLKSLMTYMHLNIANTISLMNNLGDNNPENLEKDTDIHCFINIF